MGGHAPTERSQHFDEQRERLRSRYLKTEDARPPSSGRGLHHAALVSSDVGLGALMDTNMLAVSPGQEQSLAEYNALLAAADLRRVAVLSRNSPQSVVEAVAA
jgi:hypothetical protein